METLLIRAKEYSAAITARNEAHAAWSLVSGSAASDRLGCMAAVDRYLAADNALDAATEALHQAAIEASK